MPRWLNAIVLVGVALVLGSGPVFAQSPIVLSSLQVQLWPEYDQPSMLVIYDFQLAPGTALPVSVPIRFPKEANLMAVAMHDPAQGPDGALLIADYTESGADNSWQSILVQVERPTMYRVEYYQPLQRAGQTRDFRFEWPGNIAVQNLGISLRMPSDATGVATTPTLQRGRSDTLAGYLESTFGDLDADEAITLDIRYARPSEALTAPQQGLQPTQPLDSSTPGRVMISNYIPYFLGALGVILIGGGAFYFWQTSRGSVSRQPRHRGGRQRPLRPADEIYCHECGTRAQAGDRFCRVCGARLRSSE
jgi:hypothetical protein